jgi:hypothetical protein
LATRNRAFNRLPAPQSIAEKRRAAQRFDLRLVLHVPTTTRGDHEQQQQAGAEQSPPGFCVNFL